MEWSLELSIPEWTAQWTFVRKVAVTLHLGLNGHFTSQCILSGDSPLCFAGALSLESGPLLEVLRA